VSPRYDEPEMTDWPFSPAEFAESASYFKARSIADAHPDRVILAADTVVARDGRLFGKPIDRNDARRILDAITGTTHEVITGVTLHDAARGRRLIRHATTRITMRRMSPVELDAYLDSNEWQGKAGAYGIQDRADAFVERVDGSFSNVVGLPIELVSEMLGMIGNGQTDRNAAG
jgi:septum formation protein